MGDRVQVADISPRAGPVFAALARIEKRTLGFRIEKLALEFRLAQLFADNALGRTGFLVGDRIGGPPRAVFGTFPPFPALAGVEKRALGLRCLYLAAIGRLGRGADFLVLGAAAGRGIGGNRRPCNITFHFIQHAIAPYLLV